MMTITPVESTTLAGVAYDAATKILYLEFRDSTAYCYFGVPDVVHGELLSAASKGAYFNSAIRGRFSYQRSLTRTGLSTQLESNSLS